eukprot:791354-Prymnesium_polylepis.2
MGKCKLGKISNGNAESVYKNTTMKKPPPEIPYRYSKSVAPHVGFVCSKPPIELSTSHPYLGRMGR